MVVLIWSFSSSHCSNVWWAHYLMVLSVCVCVLQTGYETMNPFYFLVFNSFPLYWKFVCWTERRATLIPYPSFWFLVSVVIWFLLWCQRFHIENQPQTHCKLMANALSDSEYNCMNFLLSKVDKQIKTDPWNQTTHTKNNQIWQIKRTAVLLSGTTNPLTQQNIQQTSEGSVKTLTSKVHSDFYCLSPRIRHSAFVLFILPYIWIKCSSRSFRTFSIHKLNEYVIVQFGLECIVLIHVQCTICCADEKNRDEIWLKIQIRNKYNETFSKFVLLVFCW